MRHARFFLLAPAFALAGCISFGANPPDSLLTLTPAVRVAAEAGRTVSTSETVMVAIPNVPQELRTNRVPVRSGRTEVAYLKDAQWVEMPSGLFASLLSETIAARTGRAVLDPRQFTFAPGVRLTGQLQIFGIDADGMEAIAVYDAVLGRGPDRIETRRFEARVPIGRIDVASAGPALNQAANQVAAAVADWIGD